MTPVAAQSMLPEDAADEPALTYEERKEALMRSFAHREITQVQFRDMYDNLVRSQRTG